MKAVFALHIFIINTGIKTPLLNSWHKVMFIIFTLLSIKDFIAMYGSKIKG